MLLLPRYHLMSPSGERVPLPRQFSILHLLMLTAATAVMLAAAKYSALAVYIACPALIGAIVGYWKSQSVGGACVGVFSAYYWCVFLCVPLGGLMVFFTFLLGIDNPAIAGFGVLVIVVMISTVGGYIGGVVEFTANEAREKRCRRDR